jgi:hypothetical protein
MMVCDAFITGKIIILAPLTITARRTVNDFTVRNYRGVRLQHDAYQI